MNFIDIAKRLRQECGVAGVGPNTLIDQSGELKRLVDWMDAAYQDIQSHHDDWLFLRREFSFPCVVGVGEYGAAGHGLVDLNIWKDDTFRCSLLVEDESPLGFCPWDEFRDIWKVGAQKTRAGRPICFSIKPDGSIVFDCIPDAAYIITGEYHCRPFPMGTDADSPVFPEQFHLALMYRAMMMYSAYSAEPDKYALGESEYRKRLKRMEINLLPAFTEGEPLA